MGHGAVWDRAADPRRHPDFESGAEAAIVAYNAPHSHQEGATEFVTCTLDHHFGDMKWNFQHQDQRTERIAAWARAGGGKVVGRLRDVKPRFPVEFYGVRPPRP